MGGKIYVVARSRTPDVEVSAILAAMGGGGHAFAASASIKNKPLVQVEAELSELLKRHIRTSKKAVNFMSSPAIKVDESTLLIEARNLVTRYINALLVTGRRGDTEELQGYISRQIIAKALYLKLDDATVREYMSTDLGSVGPDAELSEIQEKIIENKQRILPVVENNRILGVITRTDLLNALIQQNEFRNESSVPETDGINIRTRNIGRLLQDRLPPAYVAILRSAGEVADRLNCNAYVVGGFVRDLFLLRPNSDIDIVIEGEGIAFAREYAAVTKSRVHMHEKFATAVVIFPDGFKVDVVSARMEYYRFPADLPNVEMSSIKLDLFRRDFTINTLAVQINQGRFGTLIDFFSAQRDLKEKVIRILHNLSFVEDPTRVFRAIRFEQRFGFTIGKLTSELIKNAVRMDFFKRLSGRRTLNELKHILEEDNPVPAIGRLHDFDLLKIIHPDLKPTTKLIADLTALKKVLDWHKLSFLDESYQKWTPYFMILIRQFDPETTRNICERFEMAPKYHTLFLEDRFAADRCLMWLPGKLPMKNSRLRRVMSRFKVEPLLYMMGVTRSETLQKAISHYFTQLRHVEPLLRGQDLRDMGLKPGPIYRKMLGLLLDARLDGHLTNRDDEEAFVREKAARFGEPTAVDSKGKGA